MLYNWNDISSEFEDAPILLGNGFSMNLSPQLNYKHLHETFIKNCSIKAKELFQNFDTFNFEIILQNLEVSINVNSIVGIDHKVLNELHNEIRTGLIDAIRRIHPKHDEINYGTTKQLSDQLKSFSNIFTTNYDLFSYYIILDSKGHFSDYFFGQGQFANTDYTHFAQPDSYHLKHIYYLHGTLFLFINNLLTIKYKKRSDEYLLDLVTRKIEGSEYPLFISEGTSISKMKRIESNRYLNFCFDKLGQPSQAKKEERLVVFGHSLSDQDLHIAEQIDKTYKNVMVSIKPELYQSEREMDTIKNGILSKFKKSNIRFYDSNTLFRFWETI